MFHHPSFRLVTGLLLAIVLDTVTQMVWKLAVIDLTEPLSALDMILAAFHQPLFLGVLILMLGQFVNWMAVLKHADLSYAHAVTSISYATVAIASVLWLDEQVGLWQAMGIALILAGVWLVSRTPANTVTGQTDPS